MTKVPGSRPEGAASRDPVTSGRRRCQAVDCDAGTVRSASRALTSDSRNRRCPPGVRMDPMRPADAQRVTVFGSTRNMSATSPGVSSRSVSMVTLPPPYRAPTGRVTPEGVCPIVRHSCRFIERQMAGNRLDRKFSWFPVMMLVNKTRASITLQGESRFTADLVGTVLACALKSHATVRASHRLVFPGSPRSSDAQKGDVLVIDTVSADR